MGIFFSILSPAIAGISNYIDKIFLDKYKILPVVITIYSGMAGFVIGLVILFFTGFYPVDFRLTMIVLASGFLTNLYLLPYYKALTYDETSRVIPFFQSIPIFVLILSFLFLGETLSLKQYIGCFIIIFGSFMIALEKFDLKIFKIRPAFWLIMLSSFLYAISVVLYKVGVEEIPFWHTLPYEGFGMILGSLAIFTYKDNKQIFLKQAKGFKKNIYVLLSINEIIYVLARYTTYFALSLISASIVNVLSGFQPFFVLIFGIILSLWFPKVLREVINKKVLFQKITSISLMFIGLYFIFS
ncbi:MAG: hypothetical protein A3D74_03810 [Candidatus Levybacteria bacterium RIFCSPHIGHO2_02_FULL_37_13]|nr:MAG: hypothetical protein A3D74_03810 [Candidatus Levybacteria bacterium RIFCSPHIGHO2_02_FULL_37_13]OGH30421.1 MAG: hypothetical protein A3E40_01600 [Candidatus Levybacteria bacterium RIFCSPHIGHO2_12_FULL_37_9]OGH37357.1 MAG: hypothetical protein A3B41_01645 [Candidatus Levybacteria bacterium RIFCSPLOWO2_01_FULL_37_26]